MEARGEVPNPNHLMFLLENRELSRRAVRWRLENPEKWLASARRFYVHYTHLSSVNPYGSGGRYEWQVLDGRNAAFRAYTTAYVRLLYFDVHPGLRRVLPWLSERTDMEPRSSVVARLPFYGAVVLPAILLYAGWCALQYRRRRSWRLAIAILCLTAITWNLLLSVFTDGWESMRFRLATTPMCWAIACMMAAGAWRSLRARLRPHAGSRLSLIHI